MMRPDPATCRDPELLAAEVRRLRTVIDSREHELASATRHMELAEAAWLRETIGTSPAAVVLTDAEREAVAYYLGTGGPDAVDATLRGLLERTLQG